MEIRKVAESSTIHQQENHKLLNNLEELRRLESEGVAGVFHISTGPYYYYSFLLGD